MDVNQDRMGGVVLTPVSQRVRAQMRRHNKEWTGNASDTVYLQEWRGDEFVEEFMPPAKASMFNMGYAQTIRMDPWVFGHLVGYDFHEVIDP